MRRTLALAAIIVTALLFQSTVFAQIEIAGTQPELMYLVTITFAMLEGPSTGAIAGFASGMGQDFLLDQPKGITALTLTLLGYAIGRLRPFIGGQGPVVQVLVVGFGTLVGVLFYGFAAFLLGQLEAGVGFLFKSAVLSAVYNAILTPLLYPLLRRLAEASRVGGAYRW